MKMRNTATLAAGAALAVALAAGPAAAYCSKPISPYCASGGDLAGQHISRDKCDENVRRHITGLDRYRACLAGEVDKADAEIERFREMIARQFGNGDG